MKILFHLLFTFTFIIHLAQDVLRLAQVIKPNVADRSRRQLLNARGVALDDEDGRLAMLEESLLLNLNVSRIFGDAVGFRQLFDLHPGALIDSVPSPHVDCSQMQSVLLTAETLLHQSDWVLKTPSSEQRVC